MKISSTILISKRSMGYRCKSGIKRIVTLNYGYSQQKKYTFEKERKSPRKASFFTLDYSRLFSFSVLMQP